MNSLIFPERAALPDAQNGRKRAEDAFPKKCSCGAVYDESGWTFLQSHGVFLGTEERTGRRFGNDLEIRVCVCGSSVAVELKGE